MFILSAEVRIARKELNCKIAELFYKDKKDGKYRSLSFKNLLWLKKRKE